MDYLHLHMVWCHAWYKRWARDATILLEVSHIR